jgi:hypothetical protein
MSHTFYAKQDGGLALAGNKDAMLSHTTQAFVSFIMANPGAWYPAILSEFQFMVLNRCEQKLDTTRNIVLVKAYQKSWTNDEIL